jgi:transposase InsO family protein/transposase
VSLPEGFDQLKLPFIDYIQHDYEVIRPIILFSETVAERSHQTGVARTTVGDKARRFVKEGMLGLVDQRAGEAGQEGHEYPEAVASYILYLKQIYPPIHYREIVRIIGRKFGYETNHHTVKSFLERYPIPVQLELDITYFHDFEDAYQARWTVVRMWYEGWNKKSIAGCLKLSRRHVGRIIDAFERDGFAGLEDKRTRSPNHPGNQLTLPFLKEVLDIQHEYPRLGSFRVHGLLEKQSDEKPPSDRTVSRALAINREFHGAPGPWQSHQDDEEPDDTSKEMPYRPQYRHHMWFVDLRYLVELEDGWVYSICILEGYSRKILAGMASEYQDLTTVLQILFAALSAYGCPDTLVSDNGGVFRAKDYQDILQALGIERETIEKGKPWQNLIEAQFKVQLRLADYKFEQAETVTEIQDLHAEFVETFNTTSHWAHQDREDGRKTPVDVLGWVRGRLIDQERLRRLFGEVQFVRTVNRYGFVSVQRFYVYAEHGLSRKRVSVWIYEGELRIEYQESLLAEYQCDYDTRQKRLQEVSQPTLYQTSFASPQMELFELDDEQWLKVRERSYHRQMKRFTQGVEQLPLTGLGVVSSLLFCYPLVGEMSKHVSLYLLG